MFIENLIYCIILVACFCVVFGIGAFIDEVILKN